MKCGLCGEKAEVILLINQTHSFCLACSRKRLGLVDLDIYVEQAGRSHGKRIPTSTVQNPITLSEIIGKDG